MRHKNISIEVLVVKKLIVLDDHHNYAYNCGTLTILFEVIYTKVSFRS